MFNTFGDLEALVQEKIDGDNDFQATLTDLSDEDKESAIKNRKSELFDEEIRTFSEKSKKNEELANNYKTRAEKAEKNSLKSTQKEKDEDNFSIKDIVALSKIHLDDIDEVKKASKLLGKQIYEAVEDPVVKAILSQKEEFRKSSEASNTSNARRSPARLSDEALIESANSGKLPESDEEINRLIKVKMGRK